MLNSRTAKGLRCLPTSPVAVLAITSHLSFPSVTPTTRSYSATRPPSTTATRIRSQWQGSAESIIAPVNASIVEWLSIGLALVAVAVILRYTRRPRCERCDAVEDTKPVPVVASRDAGWRTIPPSEREWTAISWTADRGAAPAASRQDRNALS